MNYIKHLNQWFEVISTSEDISPYHIALYVMLFNVWNRNHFAPSFVVNRQEMIILTRIGSTSTYSKYMKQLHEKGWIEYSSSKSKYGLSKVKMLPLDQISTTDLLVLTGQSSTKISMKSSTAPTIDTTTGTTTDTSSDQDVGHLLKTENTEKEK